MTKYLKFSKNEQRTFLREAKNRMGLSWEKMAAFLGISRAMIFLYLNEKNMLPHWCFLKICKNIGKSIDLSGIKIIEISKRIKNIDLPLYLTSNLCEFIGILAGDGHLSNINYEVSITCDARFDNSYIKNHVSLLFSDIFKIQPKIIIKDNTIRCKTYSKDIVMFFSDKYKLPTGKKMGNLKIPKNIMKNNHLLKSYIRGMFDTDGSFHRHYKTTASVEFISGCPKFIRNLNFGLKKLGFHTSLTGKSIHIYRREEIDNFFTLIKPANKKHTVKYRIYKDTGKVPLNSELHMRL